MIPIITALSHSKIIVSGATGFIGRHCLKPLLNAGFEVHALTRTLPTHDSKRQLLQHPALFWHAIDLQNHAKVQDLVHSISAQLLMDLAWDTTPATYLHDFNNLNWIQSSLNLTKCFIASGGQRVLGCGTCAEYDWSAGYLTEYNTPYKSGTLYSASKIALRQLTSQICKDAKTSFIWVRPFFVHGPHEHGSRFVPQLINSAIQNQSLQMPPQAHRVRDYLPIQEAANAIVASLLSQQQGDFNIASGQAIMLSDLAKTIALEVGNALGQEIEVKGVAQSSINTVDDFVVGNTYRLNTLVGWQPSCNVASGLKATVQWWLEQSRQPS